MSHLLSFKNVIIHDCLQTIIGIGTPQTRVEIFCQVPSSTPILQFLLIVRTKTPNLQRPRNITILAIHLVAMMGEMMN
ncbi:hypothetical protein L6452_12767 [Arctium lappa]|uniref:Uncharacterized protein n=1 Tax=Arctium lappa TaxID=4217 RepID=A0ACB9CGD6_ARCLA|nr:hypothetical protein L6452_12767 [Arctium lappa]